MDRFQPGRRLYRLAAVIVIGSVAGLVSATAATGPNFNSQANLVQNGPFPQNKQNEPAIAKPHSSGQPDCWCE